MPRAKKNDNIESISQEQYSNLYAELLKVREELQALNNKRGFDHTSVPENHYEPVQEIEPIQEYITEPVQVQEPEPTPIPEPIQEYIPETPVQTQEPEPVQEYIPEPIPVQTQEPEPIIQSDPVYSTPNYAPTVSLEQYMKVYTDYVKVKEENLKLKSKLINFEESFKNKISKRKKIEGEELKNAIVDIILNSNLNIEAIPDDVEREIYQFVLTQISNSSSLIKKFFWCS